MEEMDDSVETNTKSCKKQTVCEEELEDRISSLPDSILIRILSFLPTRDAVRTVLVPGFRHLKSFLSTLTFDHCAYDIPPIKAPSYNEKFLHFIRHVLIGHQNGTIDKFVLKLDLNSSYSEAIIPANASRGKRRMKSEVDSWVHFAMRKNVKVLDLDFVEPDDRYGIASYRRPSVVFRGKYLTELKLVACKIKRNGPIQLNCLKRLAFKNPSLKSLRLMLDYDGIAPQKVKISCPYIESLEIVGHMELVDPLDVSSVAVSSTSFYLDIKSFLTRYRNAKALFKKLGRCKMFTPCNSCILVFTVWQLLDEQNLLFGWKCVKFEVELTKWHLLGISCLPKSSPYLETLAMQIYPGNETSKPREFYFRESHNFNGGNFWRLQEGSNFHCLKTHLKTIKIYGHITAPYVIESIEFLLKHAMVLEKLEISTQKTLKAYSSHPNVKLTTEQRLDFSQKLFSLTRASSSAVILFE